MKFLAASFSFTVFFCFGQFKPQNGIADSKPKMIAFKNARIVVSPTKTIEEGTLLIEGNKIVDVGFLLFIPDEAIIYDCKGSTILAAFIETYSSVGLPKPITPNYSSRPQIDGVKNGAYYWNDAIRPEIDASDLFQIDDKANEELIKMGFGLALTHIQNGISRGTGALITLGSQNPNKQIISSKAAQFYSFDKGTSNQTYPSSQMGSIALLRQVFYDLNWYSLNSEKETNISLESMNRSISLPFIFQTNDKWEILRAGKIAKEFNYQFNYLGSGNEYMAIDQLRNTKDHIILPLNFPDAFDVKDPYTSRQIPLSDLKHWELAPSNPALLIQNNVPVCFSSFGQKTADGFWKNIRMAMERGLSSENALAALTTEPAKMLKVESDFGTLEKGKNASFSIYSTDPFKDESKLLESWIQGEQKVIFTIPKHDISGKYNLFIDGKQYPLEISGDVNQWSAKIQTVKESKGSKKGTIVIDTISPNVFLQQTGDDITIQFITEDSNWKGSINLHGKVNSKFGIFEGDGMLPSGKWIQWTAMRNDRTNTKKDDDKKLVSDTAYTSKIWFPNMAYGFESLPAAETIVFRDATVWTNEDQGILKEATVIVANGKIVFVGTGNFTIPNGSKVIDAKGMHLTSGIIDEHSHIAISKGVNEGGQAISAEVSIGDVIDPEDINIYRQLSGGVTAAQLLHGSANPIGGQSALIKLKWGHSPDEMLIDNAPKFIKCALGENVKQSNWGDFNTVRFPQTRMGVEQVFYDGFNRAKNYRKEWDNYNSSSKETKIAPRKDLELEVLCEILRSERFITCHSYIQSEINMLMHVADSMDFKINTFTHILEGYKVADKMLKHGAGASTFSDWWAYKFEVNDAIPYNASMMNEMGLVVAINSDDAEMGRRLNQEAAKSVKYGGMSEEDAWKMVTLNPAKLLHLNDRMGSLKEGKDADLVLWTANPLSIEAKVDMTIIDGKILFDSKRDYLMRSHNQQEKARIITKMLDSNEKGEVSKPFFKKRTRHFHCDTLGEEGSFEENTH